MSIPFRQVIALDPGLGVCGMQGYVVFKYTVISCVGHCVDRMAGLSVG
jgi:hypothetical protein